MCQIRSIVTEDANRSEVYHMQIGVLNLLEDLKQPFLRNHKPKAFGLIWFWSRWFPVFGQSIAASDPTVSNFFLIKVPKSCCCMVIWAILQGTLNFVRWPDMEAGWKKFFAPEVSQLGSFIKRHLSNRKRVRFYATRRGHMFIPSIHLSRISLGWSLDRLLRMSEAV